MKLIILLSIIFSTKCDMSPLSLEEKKCVMVIKSTIDNTKSVTQKTNFNNKYFNFILDYDGSLNRINGDKSPFDPQNWDFSYSNSISSPNDNEISIGDSTTKEECIKRCDENDLCTSCVWNDGSDDPGDLNTLGRCQLQISCILGTTIKEYEYSYIKTKWNDFTPLNVFYGKTCQKNAISLFGPSNLNFNEPFSKVSCYNKCLEFRSELFLIDKNLQCSCFKKNQCQENTNSYKSFNGIERGVGNSMIFEINLNDYEIMTKSPTTSSPTTSSPTTSSPPNSSPPNSSPPNSSPTTSSPPTSSPPTSSPPNNSPPNSSPPNSSPTNSITKETILNSGLDDFFVYILFFISIFSTTTIIFIILKEEKNKKNNLF